MMKKFQLAVLLTLVFSGYSTAYAQGYYVSETVGPWSSNSEYTSALDVVVGSGNWTFQTYSQATSNYSSLFGSSSSMVYLQGSSALDTSLNSYLSNPGIAPSILSWVNNGGRLIIQSAGNSRVDINFANVTLRNYTFSTYGYVTNLGVNSSTYPIVYTQRSGSYLGHNVVLPGVGVSLSVFVNGSSNLSSILNDTGPVVASLKYGRGSILFSGLTDYGFHRQADGSSSLGADADTWLLNILSSWLADSLSDLTQDSLSQSASVLRGVYSLQNVSMNNNLSNDCTLFDKHGLCASVSGTHNNMAGSAFEGTNGTLTVAYRVNNNLRVGAYLDQTLNANEATGVHLNNGSPGFGGFGVWNQHVDGYGAQVRVAAGYDDKDMTVTRQVIELSEAGTGKTNLTSYGASIVASYAMWMPGDITFSPYGGIRHTKVKAGAYTETDVVTAPLTYNALTQNVTTALVGAKWTTRITDRAIAYASLGVEQDLKNNGGTYTATGVDGLTSIAFNPDINRTRRTASIGSYYNLGDRQRIGANLAWSEQAFTSIDATSLMVTYTAGF
jgi:hypothetical protein